ncbi:MAG: hypothetical protein ACE5KZ_12235 [Candidatus Scalinduaceae bacterium]
MKYKGWFEPPLLQCFKKSKGRFADTMVGNPVLFEGKQKTAKNVLIHLYDKNIEKLLDTYNFNTSNAVKDFIKRGVVIRPYNYLWYFFMKPLLVFIRGYIFKQGFKRVFPGFLWYLLRAFFRYFVAYAKLWEW